MKTMTLKLKKDLFYLVSIEKSCKSSRGATWHKTQANKMQKIQFGLSKNTCSKYKHDWFTCRCLGPTMCKEGCKLIAARFPRPRNVKVNVGKRKIKSTHLILRSMFSNKAKQLVSASLITTCWVQLYCNINIYYTLLHF